MTGFEMTEEEFEYTEEMEKRKQEADRKELLEENELLKNSDSLCKLIGEQKLKITELEDKLANADYQLEGRDNEIKELNEKIEKMKCWCNCKNYLSCLEECCRKNISFEKGICYNCKKWELRR